MPNLPSTATNKFTPDFKGVCGKVSFFAQHHPVAGLRLFAHAKKK
jgi:hypothetical protein